MTRGEDFSLVSVVNRRDPHCFLCASLWSSIVYALEIRRIRLDTHPANEFDVLRSDWRQQWRRFDRLQAGVEDLFDQGLRECGAFVILGLEPLLQHHLFASRPRLLKHREARFEAN